MSDLISKNALVKELEKFCWNQKYLIPTQVWDIVNNQPTAFDTEKVVEQLEGLSNAEADYYYARSNDVIDREYAIDIVKKGGVE